MLRRVTLCTDMTPSPAESHLFGRNWSRLLAATLVTFSMAAAHAAPEADSATVSPGKYLALAADCAACHTAPKGGAAYAGGYGIASPLGTIYASNITPSTTAGIGNYTEAEFVQAVRHGIRKDGSHLYPAMPYTSYAKISDADMHTLYGYFMHEVQPVDTKPQATALAFPFSVRSSMAVWNLLFADGKTFTADPAQTAEYNRGMYLSEALGHCSACHTPRNTLMAEQSGAGLSGGQLGSWYAPNITSDVASGVGGWTQAQLVQFLHSGDVPGKAQAAGPMAEAIEHSLQYLTPPDLNALAVYLKTSKPVHTGESTPRDGFGTPANSEPEVRGVAASSATAGALIYSGTCASCHGATGAGNKAGFYPQLFHNTATGATHADNLIATILFGIQRTVAGKEALMPAFGPDAYVNRLSDQQVADVSNYVLKQFGNAAVTVTAQDVTTVRTGGPTAPLATLGKLAVPGIVIVVLLVLAFVFWLSRRRKPTLA